MHSCLVKNARSAVALHAVGTSERDDRLRAMGRHTLEWAQSAGFQARSGELLAVPGADGRPAAFLFGLGRNDDPLALAAAAEKLPAGTYRLASAPVRADLAVLGWLLGSYSYTRYRPASQRTAPKLVLPEGCDGHAVSRIAAGLFWGRDLVATPANDMGPQDLAAAARSLARRHRAKYRVVAGKALATGFPMIDAVGRGSARPPCLIDLQWGRPRAPRLTLVGKGVCFDSGGLDLKTSAGMLTMKKDMGGAAAVLALGHMIMDAGLDVRLRILVPAVENSVSGSSYRPGDVLTSRKGLTVEIGNTDAEGRLVLADALSLADDDEPDLLIDVATLTGAARSATGMELPPFFTDDEALARALEQSGRDVADPLWRLPLWRGYENTLDSAIADLNNAPSYALAGAITAALFLNRFVSKSPRWMHLDIPAWNDRPRPGRKVGPEVNGVRALFSLISARYAQPRASSRSRSQG
ncbi:MAG: leucyl aminopeptidase family protein [Alphaproteobacteria bacterium]|nr:leucyl aminopeptidase family protein [Alphaproteobacteria bacterium]